MAAAAGSAKTTFDASFPLIQRRERIHDLHRLQTHTGHSFDEIDDVAGVVVFAAPVVGVVFDAAGFVDGDLVALHDPFEGGLAVDDVVLGFEGDAVVVNDGALVIHALAACVPFASA